MAAHLTPEELRDYEEVFKTFDTSGDGAITVVELEAALRSLGQNPTREEVRTMISGFDEDGSGTIDFNEFLQLVAPKPGDSNDLREAFKLFDKDGNGKISKSELKDMLHTMGEKVNDEELDLMISELDEDGNGEISFEEFVKVFSKV
ncbi:hypothetical protein AX16_004088 [Volvariella volvacea WC 439]|nr:hypothetical protein AX16_004088 [Volvariella volvacea WC 439]